VGQAEWWVIEWCQLLWLLWYRVVSASVAGAFFVLGSAALQREASGSTFGNCYLL
jgi:hypothetical protein